MWSIQWWYCMLLLKDQTLGFPVAVFQPHVSCTCTSRPPTDGGLTPGMRTARIHWLTPWMCRCGSTPRILCVHGKGERGKRNCAAITNSWEKKALDMMTYCLRKSGRHRYSQHHLSRLGLLGALILLLSMYIPTYSSTTLAINRHVINLDFLCEIRSTK